MASITHHHDKKTGITYVYSVESYWDKEKKAPRNRQTYLGRLNKDTGEIIPTKKTKAAAKTNKPAIDAILDPELRAKALIAGPSLVLQEIIQQTGLEQLLKKCFPDIYQEILSLVYFITQKGQALSHAETWSSNHTHPCNKRLTSQRISELLHIINQSACQSFLSLWLKKLLENDYLCYDITSVSSYAQANEYVKCGYNRDREKLPQINLAMLFGQKSKLPAYYRAMQGNITDVATLKTTIKSLDFLGASKMHFILDRGFFSETNINELFARKHQFTIAIPNNRKWLEGEIDKIYEEIHLPSNYISIDDNEALYARKILYKWGKENKRSYLHLYYNAQRAASEYDRFTRNLLKYKEELLSGKSEKSHEEAYERYLIIKKTPKRGLSIEFNEPEIQKYRKRYAGFFCILTNEIKDTEEALQIYRAKDVVENSFDDLKNQLDMKRLRIHTSAAMHARLFLQFLSLICLSQIRNVQRSQRELKNLTAREILEEMETLVQIKYSHRYGQLYTETNPRQRQIMEAFQLKTPS